MCPKVTILLIIKISREAKLLGLIAVKRPEPDLKSKDVYKLLLHYFIIKITLVN